MNIAGATNDCQLACTCADNDAFNADVVFEKREGGAGSLTTGNWFGSSGRKKIGRAHV